MGTTKQKTVKHNRSAITGKFVSKDYAKKHPKTTVEETQQGQEK
jgi:hypothetical protein